MISKSKINKRIKRKRNPALVETIILAKKNNFLELAKKLSAPTRMQASVNLDELDKLKENKIIVVGKVLGEGEIKRKISIGALGFSKQAMEKLKKSGCEIKLIKEILLEKNLDIKDVKII